MEKSYARQRQRKTELSCLYDFLNGLAIGLKDYTL